MGIFTYPSRLFSLTVPDRHNLPVPKPRLDPEGRSNRVASSFTCSTSSSRGCRRGNDTRTWSYSLSRTSHISPSFPPRIPPLVKDEGGWVSGPSSTFLPPDETRDRGRDDVSTLQSGTMFGLFSLERSGGVCGGLDGRVRRGLETREETDG